MLLASVNPGVTSFRTTLILLPANEADAEPILLPISKLTKFHADPKRMGRSIFDGVIYFRVNRLWILRCAGNEKLSTNYRQTIDKSRIRLLFRFNDANRDARDADSEAEKSRRMLEESILSMLLANPKASQAEMAREAGVSRATIQRVMDALVREGKLSRKGGTRGEWVVQD